LDQVNVLPGKVAFADQAELQEQEIIGFLAMRAETPPGCVACQCDIGWHV
jgi:hypothetical protein